MAACAAVVFAAALAAHSRKNDRSELEINTHILQHARARLCVHCSPPAHEGLNADFTPEKGIGVGRCIQTLRFYGKFHLF